MLCSKASILRNIVLRSTFSYSTNVAVEKEINNRFYLFSEPMVVMPYFELSRYIGNLISKYSYVSLDKEYTDEKFVSGAKQAITQAAKAMRERNSELLGSLMVSTLSSAVNNRLAELPEQDIHHFLNFTRDNIVNAFYHSSVVSANKAFDFDVGSMIFFGTAVACIDLKSSEPIDLSTALNNVSNDTLFCNVTVCRQLSPLGRWKISHINFFSPYYIDHPLI